MNVTTDSEQDWCIAGLHRLTQRRFSGRTCKLDDDAGVATPVQHLLQCDPCWTFSTTSSHEGAWAQSSGHCGGPERATARLLLSVSVSASRYQGG